MQVQADWLKKSRRSENTQLPVPSIFNKPSKRTLWTCLFPSQPYITDMSGDVVVLEHRIVNDEIHLQSLRRLKLRVPLLRLFQQDARTRSKRRNGIEILCREEFGLIISGNHVSIIQANLQMNSLPSLHLNPHFSTNHLTFVSVLQPVPSWSLRTYNHICAF